MIRKDVKLNCPDALQARAVNTLVQCANRYASRITLTLGQKTVNAKSLMGVLSLGAGMQETLCLCLTGEDEAQACEAICALFESGFTAP